MCRGMLASGCESGPIDPDLRDTANHGLSAIEGEGIVDPLEDAAFRALVEQAKRVCAKHPDLLPAYLAAIEEKGKGMGDDTLKALLKEVSASVS